MGKRTTYLIVNLNTVFIMEYPHINKIYVKNYKNLLGDDDVELGNLNILIGPNGCGKSNLVSLFGFLKDCLRKSGEDIDVSGLEFALDKLGMFLNGTISPPDMVTFQFEFSEMEVEPHGCVFELDLHVSGVSGDFVIKRESLYAVKPRGIYTYYRFHDKESGTGVVSINKRPRSPCKVEMLKNIPLDELGLVSISKLLEHSQYSPEQRRVYKVRRHLVETIKKWRFYNANNMNLEKIRNSEPKIGGQDTILSISGENLALVLFNLSNQGLDFEERITNAIKTVLPATRRLRAVPYERLSLTVEWYFEGIDEVLYLHEMSDGSVRMLCWAVLLHAPVLPPLLVIDEPETGLHPAWLSILAEWIKQAAQRTQVIIATHSPDLLDHFTDRTEDVICFCKRPAGFEPVHLSTKKLANQLEDGWQLGDLYRAGDPDIGGWPW